MRTYPDKKYAEIYDMIAVPRPLSEVSNSPQSSIVDLKLIAREFKRISEFSSASINEEYSKEMVDKILRSYNISQNELESYWEESDGYV